MSRLGSSALVASVTLFLVVAGIAPGVAAAQPVGGASIVGSWHLFINVDGQPDTQQSLATFTSDGAYIEGGGPGESGGHGAWQATGPNTYLLTFENIGFEEGAPTPVTIKVWASITVSTAADSLTAPFRFDVMLPDGTVVEQGKGTATGRRIAVEPF